MNDAPFMIGLHRLYHQRITHPPFTHAGEVAAWLGALQGQEYHGTKWALGLRLPGSSEADIDRAIADGVVMRTWAVRGTLHYVAPADIHWIVALVAPRVNAWSAPRYRELELDDATLTRSSDLIAGALRDGQHLTRDELFAVLAANGIATAGQRGFYMLFRAGLERLIVQGEMRGRNTTFKALAAGPTLPVDEALAELARRYFTSRGPATVNDFAHWAGLTLGDARRGLDSVKTVLVSEEIDSRTYWRSPESALTPQRPLYLLPGFDEFVLGYRDRSAVLDPQFNDAICPGGNGVFRSTIVSGGRIIGTWKRTLKKKTVEIALKPFRPLTAGERALIDAAAAEYGAFLRLQAVVSDRNLQ
jgi:hypothetical protein